MFIELLEEDIIESHDGEAVRKAKLFYGMCLNESMQTNVRL